MVAKRSAKHGDRKRSAAPRRHGRSSTRLVVTAVVVIAAAAAVWWGWTNRRQGAPAATRSTGNETSVALSSPEFAQRLVGRWQRSDAGYVIEIRSVDRIGAVDASYLNPNPIHVSRALASDAGGALDLFVELMDVGYPGATYKLRYSPEYDALVGLYHQPTAGQDFEVAFERK